MCSTQCDIKPSLNPPLSHLLFHATLIYNRHSPKIVFLFNRWTAHLVSIQDMRDVAAIKSSHTRAWGGWRGGVKSRAPTSTTTWQPQPVDTLLTAWDKQIWKWLTPSNDWMANGLPDKREVSWGQHLLATASGVIEGKQPVDSVMATLGILKLWPQVGYIP